MSPAPRTRSPFPRLRTFYVLKRHHHCISLAFAEDVAVVFIALLHRVSPCIIRSSEENNLHLRRAPAEYLGLALVTLPTRAAFADCETETILITPLKCFSLWTLSNHDRSFLRMSGRVFVYVSKLRET